MAKPYPVLEAPVLPLSCTERVDSFDNVGLDYAGPIYIKQGRKLEKAYIHTTSHMCRHQGYKFGVGHETKCARVYDGI